MTTIEEINRLKKEIADAYKFITEASQEIKNIQSGCKHEDVTPTKYGSATCNECLTYLSWYCPASPTLVCVYDHEDGSYDEDCCIYCGKPEERK